MVANVKGGNSNLSRQNSHCLARSLEATSFRELASRLNRIEPESGSKRAKIELEWMERAKSAPKAAKRLAKRRKPKD